MKEVSLLEKSVSLFIGKLEDTLRRVGLNHSFKVSRAVDRGALGVRATPHFKKIKIQKIHFNLISQLHNFYNNMISYAYVLFLCG